MASESDPTALRVYRKKLLAQFPSPELVDARVEPRDLFFHLGYWPDSASPTHTHADLRDAQVRLNDRLLAMSALHDAQRVLDVGCGVGGTISTIDQRFERMELIGLNIDVEQLAVARAHVRTHNTTRCDWVQANASAIPFRGASIDRILAIECVFHFPSRRRFFADAARLLRPGGRLVVSDFVATPALRALRDQDPRTADLIDTVLLPCVGPWPDFWADDSDNVSIAGQFGFACVEREVATTPTLPSYRCFLPGPPIVEPHEASVLADPVDRAMALMEWLQTHGMIEMVFFAMAR